MSNDAVARLESLLARVVARRAEPRVTAPVAAPVVATSPAPKPIAPEPPKAEVRAPEAPKPEAPTVEVQMIVPAEARPPAAIAAEPAKVTAKLTPEPPRPEAPKPEPAKPAALTLDAPRAPGAPKPTPAAPLKPADDRVAASFAAGASVSPGFDEDDADHVETLAFRMDRALPKPSPVSIPPLPVSTPSLAREEPVERTAERFSASLPPGPISAHVSALPTHTPAASLRSLLQRSVAIRPRG